MIVYNTTASPLKVVLFFAIILPEIINAIPNKQVFWAPGRAIPVRTCTGGHCTLFLRAALQKRISPSERCSSWLALLSPSEPVHPGGPGASMGIVLLPCIPITI